MKNLFFLLLILSSNAISAQSNIAEFIFQLYFEDAVGNKDTLTLGHDPLATNGVDVAFGEENIIDQNWSSTFEARITNEYWQRMFFPGVHDTIHLKKQILNKSSQLYRPMAIDLKCNNWPVKVSWDSTFFNPTEISGSFLTSIQYGTWFDMSRPDFLFEKNVVYYDVESSDLDHQVNSYYTSNQDEIYTIWFDFSDSTSLTVKVDNLMNATFKTHPNPFNDEFTISNLSASQAIKIFDELGRKVDFERIGDRVNLFNANSGIYFMQLVGENRIVKLVKN